nr:hypothetical protein [Tanacetum cinerariifolium]
VGKGFSGVETPLFENMLAVRDVDEEEEAQVLDTCSALAHRVEVLENDKAAQQLEIFKLKERVKKLEKIKKVKSSKLKRLKKDEGIELVVDQEKDAEVEGRHAYKQAEIYNIDLDHSLKVLSMQEDDTEVQEAVEVVTTAKLITEVVTAATTQVVAASTPIPAAKPKILKIAAAPVKKDQVEMDAEYAKKLQEELDKEHEEAYKNIDWNAALDHVQSKEPQYIKRYHGIKKKPQFESEAHKNMISDLKNTKESSKKKKLIEEAQKADDLKKSLEIVQDEDDDVFVEATPFAQKVPVVDYQVVVIDNKPKYKIIRADDTHQFYISFTTLLKNFDREDLETLWRIVRDRFSTSKPTNFLDEYLLLTLKTMFGELDGQDAIWSNQKSVHGLALVKRWKLLTSCGVYVIILSTVQLFLLVERRYPLSRFTLEQLVNVARLQVEEESEMSLELLRFTRQQLQEYQKG